MSTIFETLAEPNRRRIVELLRSEQRSVGELVDALGLSQPAVSKHLRVLKEAGVVNVEQDAQRRLYSLRREALMELDAWLTPYRVLWEERFDRLDSLLKEMNDEEKSPLTTDNQDE